MAVAEELKVLINVEVQRALAKMKAYGTGVDGAKRKTQQWMDTANKVGKGLTVGLTLPILGAAAAGLKAAASFEKQRTALSSILGSIERGGALFDRLKDFAATTPFQMEQLSDATIKLISSGTKVEDVTKVLRRLGNAARGDRLILDRLSNAFSKVQILGRASMEELRQFAEAGVPIFDELRETMGLTTEELRQYISAGKIGFEEVNTALANLTEGTGQLAGLIEAQSKTLDGLFSTLKDNLRNAADELFKAYLPAIKDAISRTIEWVQKIAAATPETKRLIVQIVGLTAALGPALIIISKLVKIFTSTNPWVLAAVGIVAATAALVIWIKRSEEARKNITDLAEVFEGVNEAINDTEGYEQAQRRLEGLERTLQGTAQGIAQAERVVAEARDREAQALKRAAAAAAGGARISGDPTAVERAKIDAAQLLLENLKGESVELNKQRESLQQIITNYEAANMAAEDLSGTVKDTTDPLDRLASQILLEVNNQLAAATQKAKVFGSDFDLLAAKADIYRKALEDATDAGIGAQSGLIRQELLPAYDALIGKLERRMQIEEETRQLAATIAAERIRYGQEEIDRMAMVEAEKKRLHSEELARIAAEKAARNAALMTIFNMTLSTINQIGALQDSRHEKDIRQLEEQLEASMETWQDQLEFKKDLGLDTEEFEAEIEQKRKDAEAKIEEERNKLEQKKFNREKLTNIANATMAGAVGVVNALKAGPLGIPLASIIAGLTAAQIGIIAAQKYPGFAKGGDFTTTGPTTVVAGENGRERVRIDPMPDNRARGGGAPTILNINGPIISVNEADEFLEEVDRGLERLRSEGRIA